MFRGSARRKKGDEFLMEWRCVIPHVLDLVVVPLGYSAISNSAVTVSIIPPQDPLTVSSLLIT
jgi:hypothetical protein